MNRVMIGSEILTQNQNDRQQPGETSSRDIPKGNFLQSSVQKIEQNSLTGYFLLQDSAHNPRKGEAG